MSAPRHLLAAQAEIARELRRARYLAVFTDFDGTLVRITQQPDQARLGARVKSLLAELARRGVVIGVVSGRRLEDLRERVGLDGIWYVGVHGFFLLTPGNRAITLPNRRERGIIARAERALARRLSGVPGVVLEPKRATLAVHYRLASRRNRALAAKVTAALLQRYPHLTMLAGKKVWELLPAGKPSGRPGAPAEPRIHKWAAIQLALEYERRQRPRGHWLVFYLGDDSTDELVFQKLEGVSVAVGRTRHTAARYYLRSPTEVRQFLQRLNQWLP
jgi:alpha,alpha-trehalase